MSSEERLTTKQVAEEVMPSIVKARKILAAHLTSLRYLHVVVNGKLAESYTMDEFSLREVFYMIELVEKRLCLVT